MNPCRCRSVGNLKIRRNFDHRPAFAQPSDQMAVRCCQSLHQSFEIQCGGDLVFSMHCYVFRRSLDVFVQFILTLLFTNEIEVQPPCSAHEISD